MQLSISKKFSKALNNVALVASVTLIFAGSVNIFLLVYQEKNQSELQQKFLVQEVAFQFEKVGNFLSGVQGQGWVSDFLLNGTGGRVFTAEATLPGIEGLALIDTEGNIVSSSEENLWKDGEVNFDSFDHYGKGRVLAIRDLSKFLLFYPVKRFGSVQGYMVALIDSQTLLNEFTSEFTGFKVEFVRSSVGVDLLRSDEMLFKGFNVRISSIAESVYVFTVISILGGLISLGLIILFTLRSQVMVKKEVVSPILNLASAVKGAKNAINLDAFNIQSGDEIERLSKAFRDVFERTQLMTAELENKVEERTADLEKALQVKSNFLSNMSHEIRTPLNGIIGTTELLEMDSQSMVDKEKLKTLMFSAEHLLSIVNDILDFSKIETGKFKITYSDFDVIETIHSVMETFKTQVEDKRTYLRLQTNCEALLIKSDRHRVRQILFNLIGNAVKFTNQGGVIIDVSLEKGEKRDVLTLEVIDSGVGIQKVDQENVFKPFEQGTNARISSKGGTGLGLVICKGIAKVMGGDITFESEYTVGSRFKAVIPVKFISDRSMASKVISKVSSEGAKELGELRVLLAEDDDTNQSLMKHFFSKMGASLTVVDNGLEAVEVVKKRSNDFDLVLMDIQMPIMDGVTATQRIKELEGVKRLPIVALTANATEEHKQKYLENGMDDFLGKPLKYKTLVNLLEKYVA